MGKDKLDQIFQNAVDTETKKHFDCSIDELLNKNDYGSMKIINQGIEINIGWWKWKINENRYHIVFIATRKIYLFFYKKYLSGIKFDNKNNTIEYLSNEEISIYD